MKVKATVSFSGAVSAIKGKTLDITNKQVLNDLLSCGYVVSIEERTPLEKSTVSKRKTRAVSGNENK